MFWNKKSVIKFHTSKELLELIPHPVPSMKAMPKWYKNLKPTVDGQDKAAGGTIKRCMPVLDGLSNGYIIPLWCDLQVKVAKCVEFLDEDGKVVHKQTHNDPDKLIGTETSKTKDKIASHRPSEKPSITVGFSGLDMQKINSIGTHSWEQVGTMCDLKKFSFGKVLMKFTNPWIIETSPGWSVLIKPPANNWATEIELIEAIVDTDTYYNEINFPFVWTGSEEGEFIIPRGTPLAQVIPFKREYIELEVGQRDDDKANKTTKRMLTKFYDRYKTFYRAKRNNGKCPLGF